MLLHVIDASDPFVDERIEVVHQVLADIGAHQDKILVFNKCDLIDEQRKTDLASQYSDFQCVFISVKEGLGFDKLRERLIEKLK